jgi:RIO-like serine/threonine protein kinase
LSFLSYGSCDFTVELYSVRYTLLEVMDMTDNYANQIGEGRSGTVYHGKLLTGQEVAVKVWAQRSRHRAAEEFQQFRGVSGPNA